MINGEQFVLAKTPNSEYSISLEAELDNMIAKMMELEKEFEALTGVDFSLDNLKELKCQTR